MSHEVKITVEGKVATGKTTLAAIISDVLKNFGYNVTYEQSETRSVKAIDTERAQRTHVIIEEKQLPRV